MRRRSRSSFERLGVPISQVQIVHGDTDKVQFGMALTAHARSRRRLGDRQGDGEGEAKGKKIAAHLLEASEGDIVIENGEFKVTGTDKSIALPMVALRSLHGAQSARRHGARLKETAFYDPTNFTSRRPPYICELEVDAAPAKRLSSIRRGRRFRPPDQSMNRRRPGPWRLARESAKPFSRARFMTARCQLVTASSWTTPCRARTTCPSFKLNHTTTLCPGNPLGVKGCGRGRCNRRFRCRHQRHHRRDRPNKLEMPATPDRVWHAIHGSAQ